VVNFEVSFRGGQLHWNQELESVVLGTVQAKIVLLASGISEVFAFVAEPIGIFVFPENVRVEVVLAFLIFGAEVVGGDVVVLVGWAGEMVVGV